MATFASIMKDVEALLVFLERGHFPTNNGEGHLRSFYEELAIQASLEGEAICDDLEIEFYSLLEQWPDLRRSYLAMSQAQLHETCSNALQELLQLSHQRELTAYEAVQKRNLEQALTETTKQINDLLNCGEYEAEKCTQGPEGGPEGTVSETA